LHQIVCRLPNCLCYILYIVKEREEGRESGKKRKVHIHTVGSNETGREDAKEREIIENDQSNTDKPHAPEVAGFVVSWA